MKAFVALLILASASLNSECVAAEKPAALRADRIQVSYVPPKNTAHQALFQLLKERRVLDAQDGFADRLRKGSRVGAEHNMFSKTGVDQPLQLAIELGPRKIPVIRGNIDVQA